MEPRFGSNDDGLAVYVQRSATLVYNTVFTIATKLYYRLQIKIKTNTYNEMINPRTSRSDQYLKFSLQF